MVALTGANSHAPVANPVIAFHIRCSLNSAFQSGYILYCCVPEYSDLESNEDDNNSEYLCFITKCELSKRLAQMKVDTARSFAHHTV